MKKIFLFALCFILLFSDSASAYVLNEFKETTNQMCAFGLGDYVVYENIKDRKFHFFISDYGKLKEFIATDNALDDGQALSLADSTNGTYFAAILNGKYAIFTHSFKQITPNKYTWITFYDNMALGEISDEQMSPNDHSKTKYELIDLTSGKILISTKGALIRITDDGQYYVTDYGIYDKDGKKLFEPKTYKIISDDVQHNIDFVWIGTNTQDYALFHNNEQKSDWYEDILPRTMLNTQLLTANKDGKNFLLGLDGNVITQTSGTISLLSTDVAAVTENNTVAYWNHKGRIHLDDKYSTVVSLYTDSPGRSTHLIVKSNTTDKWGIIGENGTEVLPPLYDTVENISYSDNIYKTVRNGITQIWNLNSELNISYRAGLELSTYIGDHTGKWLASLQTLENGITIADLYNENGEIIHKNIHKIFYLDGQELYAKAVNIETDNYHEVLETADGQYLFSAPSNENISFVSNAIIQTISCKDENNETTRSFLNLSFQSTEPQFSYFLYYLMKWKKIIFALGFTLLLIIGLSIKKLSTKEKKSA